MVNRAKRLTGINPLAYLGVEPLSPPELVVESFGPTTTDIHFNLGTLWVVFSPDPEEITPEIWMLVNLNGGVATWVQIYPVAAGDLTFVAQDSTTAHPDAGGNINLIGDAFVSTTASGNTVNFHTSGELAHEYTTDDSNHAIAINGILNIFGGTTPGTGSGKNINTTSSANTVDICLNNAILWPNTTSNGLNGVIYFNNNTFMHAYDSTASASNTFLGASAGNLTNASVNNVGIGYQALSSVTGGSSNTAVGMDSLLHVTSGSSNVAVGPETGASLTTGTDNVIMGNLALLSATTGVNNIIIGSAAGSNYSSSESNNIILGSNNGIVTENNVMRLGGGTGSGTNQQNKCFVSGINGSSITATGVVQINGSDQVSASNGTNGQVLIGGGSGPVWSTLTAGANITITNAANSITIASSGGGSGITSVTGNTGGAVGADGSNNINIKGDGTIVTVAGNAGTHTETISLVNGTNGQLIIGGGTGAAWANLTSSGATVTITNGPNSINLEATGGSGTTAFVTNSGTANESGGSITIVGGSNINTSGSGHTVTVNLDNTVSISGTFTANGDISSTTGSFLGDGLGITGNAIISGTVELSSFGAGVVQSNSSGVLASSNGTNGQVLIGGGAAPAWNNLTAGTGISITNSPNNITISSTGSGGSFADPFLACQFADYTNVGAGLSRQLNYNLGSLAVLNKIYDVGGNFFIGDGVGGSATFTAPATGYYYLHFQCTLTNKSAFTASVSILSEPVISIVTPNRSFSSDQFVSTAAVTSGSFIFNAGTQGPGQFGDNFHTWNITAIADMTSGDVATFNVDYTIGGNASCVVVGTNTTTRLATYVTGYRVA